MTKESSDLKQEIKFFKQKDQNEKKMMNSILKQKLMSKVNQGFDRLQTDRDRGNDSKDFDYNYDEQVSL